VVMSREISESSFVIKPGTEKEIEMATQLTCTVPHPGELLRYWR
jgi:hypothetical protein